MSGPIPDVILQFAPLSISVSFFFCYVHLDDELLSWYCQDTRLAMRICYLYYCVPSGMLCEENLEF